MLSRLSGRDHDVITAFSLCWIERDFQCDDYETTRVKMRTLRKEEIIRYIESGEPLDKAGAYGIQGQAAAFVETVNGCYFNVVGLPVSRVLEIVNDWLLRPRNPSGVHA